MAQYAVEVASLNSSQVTVVKLADYLNQHFPKGMPLLKIKSAFRQIVSAAVYLRETLGRQAIIDDAHVIVQGPGNDTPRFCLVHAPEDATVAAPNVGCVALGVLFLEMTCGRVVPGTVERAGFCANLNNLFNHKLKKTGQDVFKLPPLEYIGHLDLIAAETKDSKTDRQLHRAAFYGKHPMAFSARVNVGKWDIHVIQLLFGLGLRDPLLSDVALL